MKRPRASAAAASLGANARGGVTGTRTAALELTGFDRGAVEHAAPTATAPAGAAPNAAAAERQSTSESESEVELEGAVAGPVVSLLKLCANALGDRLDALPVPRLRALGARARTALLSRALAARHVDAAHVSALWAALAEVRLCGAIVADETVLALAADCSPQLRAVSLAGAVRVRDASLAALARAAPNLAELDIAHCRFTDGGLVTVGAVCAGLCALDVSWNGAGVTDAAACALAAGCPRLTRVNLSGSAVTDRGVAALTAACAELAHLGLRQCIGVSEGGLRAAIGRCVYLESADLCICPALTDATVAQVRARARAPRHDPWLGRLGPDHLARRRCRDRPSASPVPHCSIGPPSPSSHSLSSARAPSVLPPLLSPP